MYSSLFSQLQQSNKLSINIFVFRTNLNSATDIDTISHVMDASAAVLNWSVDIEDIDKVLRIESLRENANEIIELVRLAGYQCEELPD
ncbi:MAG: hypothetical protein AB7O48_13945 [Cyclobacteriaceae bacterium]